MNVHWFDSIALENNLDFIGQNFRNYLITDYIKQWACTFIVWVFSVLEVKDRIVALTPMGMKPKKKESRHHNNEIPS